MKNFLIVAGVVAVLGIGLLVGVNMILDNAVKNTVGAVAHEVGTIASEKIDDGVAAANETLEPYKDQIKGKLEDFLKKE